MRRESNLLKNKNIIPISVFLVIVAAILLHTYTGAAVDQPSTRNTQLYKGWNLIGVFGTDYAGDPTDPFTQEHKWIHDGNDYVDLKTDAGIAVASSGPKAFWVYSDSEDTVTSTLTEYKTDEISLTDGWNFVAILPDMAGKTLDSISKECDITSAYVFDTKLMALDPPQTPWTSLMPAEDATFVESDVGRGMIIKVSRSCNFVKPVDITCTDTDDPNKEFYNYHADTEYGYNIYVRGKTTGLFHTGEIVTNEDYCDPSVETRLIEWACVYHENIKGYKVVQMGGEVCPNGCEAGACLGAPLVTCVSPEVDCGGFCVDVTSNPYNCGACGLVCAEGYTCQNGACVQAPVTCVSPETDCNGACVDVFTDSENCGSCYTACASGETCVEGVCSSTITPPVEYRCDDSDDLNKEYPHPDFEGSYGYNIYKKGILQHSSGDAIDSCIEGATKLIENYCLANGESRNDIITCSCDGYGACIAAPTTECTGLGKMLCNGVCVNLHTDSNNCGGCDRVCEANEFCEGAVCLRTNCENDPEILANIYTQKWCSDYFGDTKSGCHDGILYEYYFNSQNLCVPCTITCLNGCQNGACIKGGIPEIPELPCTTDAECRAGYTCEEKVCTAP